MTYLDNGLVPSERPVLTVQEVAELFGVSRWLVQQSARTGELPCIRLGRRILFSRARVESLLIGDVAGPTPPEEPAATGLSAGRSDEQNPAVYPQIVSGGAGQRSAVRR
jgi:excisionase family DNA binding protein